MDSIIYILFTVQLYHAVVVCKADNIICGMSEKESFKRSFDEAIRYLNNISSNTFIWINPNQGLQQIIETGLTVISVLRQKSQDNVHLFTDLNRSTNGIISEVLEFQITRLQITNVMHIDSTLDIHQKV